MNSKQAHALIEIEKNAREIKRLAELQNAKHYAKAGYEFAKKPTRAKKNADTETATE